MKTFGKYTAKIWYGLWEAGAECGEKDEEVRSAEERSAVARECSQSSARCEGILESNLIDYQILSTD